MIYKVLVYNCYFHQIEKRYISFCSFLASISPGASANFSCSSRKSSGVDLSFKTLTSFFRPSISLKISRSASDSVSLCSSFLSSVTQLLHPDPCSFWKSPQKHPLLGQRSSILRDSNLAEYRRSRQEEQILGFVQIQLAQPASTFPPYQTHFLL